MKLRTTTSQISPSSRFGCHNRDGWGTSGASIAGALFKETKLWISRAHYSVYLEHYLREEHFQAIRILIRLVFFGSKEGGWIARNLRCMTYCACPRPIETRKRKMRCFFDRTPPNDGIQYVTVLFFSLFRTWLQKLSPTTKTSRTEIRRGWRQDESRGVIAIIYWLLHVWHGNSIGANVDGPLATIRPLSVLQAWPCCALSASHLITQQYKRWIMVKQLIVQCVFRDHWLGVAELKNNSSRPQSRCHLLRHNR